MIAVAPFLMFQGRAEEAVLAYVAAVPESRILSVERYEAGGTGPEGSVRLGRASIGGLEILFSDSPVTHGFGFTPSLSLFVTCRSEAEMERITAALVRDGEFLMPPDDYGFSRRFAWLNDRFGVSWQINLE